MSHFTYEFGGQYYLQLKGGPIGGPATSILSDCQTEVSLEKLEEIFEKSEETSSVKLLELSNFVDACGAAL